MCVSLNPEQRTSLAIALKNSNLCWLQTVMWGLKLQCVYRTRSYLDLTIIFYTAALASETLNLKNVMWYSYEDCFSRTIFAAMYIDQISA